MNSLLSKLAVGIVSVATFVAGLFGGSALQPQDQPVGAQIPVVVSLFETSLASKIASTDTSMTLISGSDRNGTALSGYMCFTIDEGTASVEFVCGTASSTSVTSLTRGIDPLTGTTAVSSLKKEHRRGATVKITNYPQLAIVSRVLNGDDTLPNKISYTSHPTFTSNTELVDKKYADDLALAGATTASGTLPGIVELASRTQLSAGTAMDGAYTLVPQNAFFNSTFQAATTVPVTGANGKLSQSFLDLTQDFTWSGAQTFNTATTTFNAPVVIATATVTTLITSQGFSFASSTVLNANGNATSTATYSTSFTPRTITVYYHLQGSNGGTAIYSHGTAVFNGTTLVSNLPLYKNKLTTDTVTFVTTLGPKQESAIPIADGSSDDVDLSITSVTSSGFTISSHHYGNSNGVDATFTVIATP